MELEDVKLWLRIDHDEEDSILEMLIESSKSYYETATGFKYENEPKINLFCMVLISDWYENRELTGKRVSEKVRFTVQSMLAQLQFGKE